MKAVSHKSGEAGVILLTTLLIMMIISALMVGFYAAVNSDVRAGAIDRDQTQAYAAAHAGLEKLTSDLAQLFEADVSPSSAQILALANNAPVIAGFEFRAPGGTAGSGYNLAFSKTDANGNPAPEDILGSNITAGPYAGMKGIITKYPITITARSITGNSEVRLRRELQTVAVPVFQFGVFSETDLSIYAGGDFGFGGRVHTNGSLFVGQQSSAGTMTFNDRITAVNEVVRTRLANGLNSSTSNPSFNNNVLVPTSASTNRNLRYSPNEGSVAAMPGSTANTLWEGLSKTTYKLYIRTGLTGASRLDLPLVSEGATPVDLIRRPVLNGNENTVNPTVFAQRFFSQASLRILLSDRITDITDLPTVTSADPILLSGDWAATPPYAGYVVGAVPPNAAGTLPPLARSIGPASTATVAGSQWNLGGAANMAQIRVTDTSILATHLLPQLTINNGGVDTVVTCTGKNGANLVNGFLANSFFGCKKVSDASIFPVAVLGGATTITATLPSGPTVQKTAVATAAGVVTLAANETAWFSPNLIWVSANAAGTLEAAPVTCQGYSNITPRQFINCSGLSAAPPAANGGVLNVSTQALATQNTTTIGGYIKIEKQSAAGVWTDVTMEVLNLGIGARNQGGFLCADPTPDAILRIQRLRDNAQGNCTYASTTSSWDWWPQALYDAREGSLRVPGTTAPMTMGGIMHYIALDVGNLKKWLAGTTGTTGNLALNNNGYIVYFSDRRGNHDILNDDDETGEFGFEDHVNPTTAAGTPDDVMQTGENVNGNSTQQTYGKIPSAVGGNIPAGSVAPYGATLSNAAGTTGSSPWAIMTAANAGQARVNKVVLFRRALKIVNGGINAGVNNLPTAGLTIATENPAYVQGNYNAVFDNTAAEPNVPASILADAITLLSNAWTDYNSFDNPNSATNRDAAQTGWRFAALAGKGLSFTYCAAACGSPGDLYGTDGGAANFLRLLEDWGSAGGLNYRGSLISLHVNRQAIGTYKFPAAHVYNGGGRNFNFDIEFLTPSLLPPGTPMFRDVNTLTFRQILRPTQ